MSEQELQLVEHRPWLRVTSEVAGILLEEAAVEHELRSRQPLINYPVSARGELVTRKKGRPFMPRPEAPPPEQPGSVDWACQLLFGSVPEALRMIESIVAGAGSGAPEHWKRLCLLYRQWERWHTRGKLESPPTLNQVCYTLDFPAERFLGELQASLQQLNLKLGQIKASQAAPQVLEAAIQWAQTEGGAKDRELVLEVAGVLQRGRGLQVNVNQQVAVTGERERLKAPLLQFRETVEAIDSEVREVVEGEIVGVEDKGGSSNEEETAAR
jgi:hypothetical protein